jgi:ABC-type bacteriocin/lantibiotic exporter with double-glycine peptidase domain
MGRWTRAVVLGALVLGGVHLLGCAGATRYVGVGLNEEACLIEGVPSVRQSPELACGPACLAAVAAYWAHEIPPGLPDAVAPFRGSDTSATDLCAAAQAAGFDAFAFCGTLDDLETNLRKGRPVIIMAWCGALADPTLPLPGLPTAERLLYGLWPPRHWTVVIGTIGAEWFVIQDPAAGRYQVRKERLLRGWKRNDCVMVLLAPREPEARAPASGNDSTVAEGATR